MSIFVSEGIMYVSQDLLVPSTYAIPLVQLLCSWYSCILYSPQIWFKMLIVINIHSEWAQLSCLPSNDKWPLPHLSDLVLFALIKILTILCCLAARYLWCFFPLSLHILLGPIFFCVFHAYDHFACQLDVVGFLIFFFPLSFYYCTNIIGSFLWFSMQMIIWVLNYFVVVGWVDM